MLSIYQKTSKVAIPFVFILLLSFAAKAQNYIHHATYLGGSNQEVPTVIKTVNGEVHILGYGNSANYPVTNGSTLSGGYDLIYTKINVATGNVLFSTYLGGSADENSASMLEVRDNIVYILTTTTSTNYPVTNGSTHSGGIDIVYTKINSITGQILFSTYIGGAGNDMASSLAVDNGIVHIAATSTSANYPVTNGSTRSGLQDMVYTQFDDATNRNILSTYIGGSNADYAKKIVVVGSVAHILGGSESTDFPVTDGSINQSNGDITYTQVAINTGAVQYATFLGGTSSDIGTDMQLVNGVTHILAQTLSLDYPVTNGSIGGYYTAAYTQLNTATGARLFSAFIAGTSWSEITTMAINNGSVYFAGNTYSLNYPIVNGNPVTGDDVVVTKMNIATHAIAFSTSLGGCSAGYAPTTMAVSNDAVHILAYTYDSGYRVTNGTTNMFGDAAYTKLDAASGNLVYSTFLGGTGEWPLSIAVSSEGAHLLYPTYGTTNPVTNGSSFQGGGDMVYTQFRACPTTYSSSTALTPATQSVCQNGVVNQIAAAKIVAINLPLIYVAGAQRSQTEIEAHYQWQESATGTGAWANIAGATTQNYSPLPTATNKYYRRIARNNAECGSAIVNTSQVSSVLLSGNIAPVANAGGIFNTCVATAVNIGNATIATGGTPPYTILWDNSLPAIAQPSVSAAIPSVFTLKITDALGCIDYDQAIVNPYAANAGVDVGNCAGASVRIGSAPIPGVAGVVYAWAASPADPSMSCTNCAQPTVNPSVATTYTLSVTVPVTGGTTCTTTDNVVVTPVAAPTTPNFAGTDVVICIGSTAPLGTAPEAGYTYTWAPGNYLTSNSTANTTFQPGSLALPPANPGLYYLTAIKGGCSFVDEVETAVIEARAGVDGCGPRYVGEPDRTPNLNETYTWTKISGPGNFAGATNLPQVPVTASVGGATTYQLAVSYTLNGITQTCTDQVIVPDCGCVVDITVAAPFACPSFSLNSGAVQLIATAGDIFSDNPSLFTYTWSPAAGLSTTTGRNVSLTDNVNRTYTVTMASPFDASFHCTRTIEVNHPAWSLPTFTAQDPNICSGQSAAIGQATVAGYSYLWSGNSLSSNTVSNPVATPTTTTSYLVRVTDIGSGCIATDIATVSVITPLAAAGPDLLVCNAGSVILGTPAQPNTTYQWSPSGGITYLNGTSSTSAQPEFIVATTSTYTVLATNTITGCTASDAVTVTVGTPVAPFTLPTISYCPSAGAVTLNVAGIPAGMASYSWTPATQVTSATTATTTTLAPPPSSSTTYTLTAQNASGCAYTTTQTINPTVTAPIVASNQIVCYSSNPALNEHTQIGGPAVSGATYTWTPATNLDNPNIANPTFTPTAAGTTTTYTVTKVEGGCTSTAQITITVNGFTLPAIANPTVCQNTSIQIGTTPVPGKTYSWLPTTGLSDPNIANPIATVGTQNISYTLTAINESGCIETATIVVGVNASPSPTITVAPLTACFGDNNVSFTTNVSPSGTYNYEWSPNNGTLSSIYAANPTVNITGVGSSAYQLTVTNAATGCRNTATTSLTVTICSAAPQGSVGNYVWNDINGNGLNDESASAGINGVTVELWNATTNTLVASTTTANDGSGNPGYYNFVVTTSGNYYIKFPLTNGSKNLTTQTVTAAIDNNSDANATTGISPTFTIDINGTGTAKDNMTIDAGYTCPGGCMPITITKTR